MVAAFIAYCLLPSLSPSTTNQIRTTGDGVSDLLAAAAADAEKCPLSVIFTTPFGFALLPRLSCLAHRHQAVGRAEGPPRQDSAI